MKRFQSSWQILCCGLAVAAVTAGAARLYAQQQFQFVVSATDANGNAVTDLKPEEVVMTEDKKPVKILKVEPLSIPVRLTIAVDNGASSGDTIAHYRSGLTAMVEALPPDVEVTLVTTAPQPRMVVKPTKDRAEILRGITRFAPDDQRPRFTDSFVEFSQRVEKDLKERKVADYIPILLSLSTTTNEQADYQPNEVTKAATFLQQRKGKLYAVIFSGKANADLDTITDLNTNRQAMLAIPIAKATGGRFESLAISNRLNTLLPEFGKEIAEIHKKHANQVRVTVQRPDGMSGPLQNPEINLARPGLTGTVSLDGFF